MTNSAPNLGLDVLYGNKMALIHSVVISFLGLNIHDVLKWRQGGEMFHHFNISQHTLTRLTLVI